MFFFHLRGTNKFLMIFLAVLLLESLFSTILKYWYGNRPKIGKPWYVPDVEKDLDMGVSKKKTLCGCHEQSIFVTS